MYLKPLRHLLRRRLLKGFQTHTDPHQKFDSSGAASKITNALNDNLGIDFKPVAAETGVRAQLDSIKANCTKAIPDRFQATEQQLRAFEAVEYTPFEAPDLNDDSCVEALIRDAICHMDKSKSAGSDGFAERQFPYRRHHIHC